MAEEHRHRGQPRNDQHESQYPPLPGEEEDRARGLPHHPRPAMAAGAVTLPSIQDPSGPYGQPPARVWDSRSASSAYGASPSSANGYPPPGNAAPPSSHSNYSPPHQSSYPPPPSSYLPPVQPHPTDARGSYPPPPPPQAGRMPPSIYGTPPQAHHSMMQQQSPYSRDSYGYPYGADRGYPGDYGQGGPGQAAMHHPQQAAPRQRTSIACRYCRRRKIRCSGYQNSPGGKCSNCMKMNQECVFQPVSSSASTAFVPVSALQNIPAGTQLYGAYGQPLHGSGAPPYPPPGQYDQPLPSPTGSFGGYPDDRADASRRRQRPPEEDHAVRLPPPTTFPDDNIRRRSPSSSSSPNHLAPYGPLSTQQPPQPGYDGRTPPQPVYDGRTPPQPLYDGRTPPPRGSPLGAAVPPPPSATGPPPTTSGTSSNSVMSLGSIMDSNHDIDRGMLGRLNQRKK